MSTWYPAAMRRVLSVAGQGGVLHSVIYDVPISELLVYRL